MILVNEYVHGVMIGRQAGAPFDPRCGSCISRISDNDGRLLGGVTYEGNNGASMVIHVAGFDPHWINPDMLWVTFHYPFEQLGVKKLLGKVCSSNTRAIAFDTKLGFREEARVKDVFPDGDLIIFGMYRDECRWLKLRPRHIAARGATGNG